MSFFSQWFRKAPSPLATPASAPSAASATAAAAQPKPSAADRALAAAEEDRVLQVAIEGGDVETVARLVVAGTSTAVRQRAAHAIDDADRMQQLIRAVRGGKDNNVYKVLTAKRDRLAEQARQHAQLQAEIAAASVAIEQHSQRPFDGSYGPLLDQFETRWEAVAAQADAAQRGTVEQWISQSRETIAAHGREAAAQAAREVAAAQAAAEAQQLRQQQREADAALAAEQAQALAAQRRVQAEQQQAEQQALRQISELIRKARAALSEGGTARAAAVRRSIEQQMVGAPLLPANVVSQLQQLDQKLEELKDWKSFSVAPKRAELIEAMEALIDATLEPLPLADRIKSLQEQWRTLGKGAGENDETDQQRFKNASQKAYQPCRDYFAAQALILQENLRRREVLLAELTAFEAAQPWPQADWRLVANTLRDAKAAWRLVTPVDHRAGRPQQEAFSTLTAHLKDRLDAEHARNVAQKTALIERAQSLLSNDDTRQTIDAIKALQQAWRAVGPVPREADQRLWETFRQHCDAVFQKRQQASDDHAAELERNKAQAQALCEQLEKLAAADAPELRERAVLGELRSAFEAVGELPPAEARALRTRFDRGVDRCEASVRRQQARDAEQSWSDLFEAGDLVRAYWLAVAQGVGAEQCDALKAAAEGRIAAVPRWPKNGLQALRQALVTAHCTTVAEHEAALRLLCIRAEILTDRPTPPEDQAMRREYQLQRLVQRMGLGDKADNTPLDSLAIEWLGVGAVESATYASLVQRFRRCRERA